MPIRRRPERAPETDSDLDSEQEQERFTMQDALAEARARGGEVSDALNAMLSEATRRVEVLSALSAELAGAELAAGSDWD